MALRMPEHPPRPFSQPRWQGEPLAGRTILLHAEQGLGDTLQFVRYAPLVKSQSGGVVLLECQRELVRLLGRCRGVDRVLATGDPLPPFDVHVPLLSLPGLMGTTSLDKILPISPISAPMPTWNNAGGHGSITCPVFASASTGKETPPTGETAAARCGCGNSSRWPRLPA